MLSGRKVPTPKRKLELEEDFQKEDNQKGSERKRRRFKKKEN